MSCARNLVEACEAGSLDRAHTCTKQIFGLCDRFGVRRPERLFREYCRVIVSALELLDRDVVVRHLHEVVWDPGQRALTKLVGFRAAEWRSMLTFTPSNYPACTGTQT